MNGPDPDRLTSAPLPAKVCPNCSAYYIGIRCESCKWTEDDDADGPPRAVAELAASLRSLPVAVEPDDDADEVDEPTDDEPTQPEESQP